MPTLRAMFVVLVVWSGSANAAPPTVDETAARATATTFLAALDRGDAAAIEGLLQAPITTSLAPLDKMVEGERRASKACARLEKARTIARAGVKAYARCLAERKTASTHHELEVTAAGARVRVASAPPASYMASPDEEGVVLELERVRDEVKIRAIRIEVVTGGTAGGGE